MTRLIQRHDQFSKQLLDQAGLADIFLRERLPAPLVARLSPEPAVDRSESFIDPVLAEHRGDRVYALTLNTGAPVLVWTLLEHKSAPEADSLTQILSMLSAIAGRGAVRRENADGTVWLAPALVSAVVLYHGARRWPLPLSLGQAWDLPDDAVRDDHLLNFAYSLVNLGDIPDAALSRDPSLQAGLLVLKYALRDDDPWVTLDRMLHAAARIDLTQLLLVIRYLFKASDTLDRAQLRTVLQHILPGQEEQMVSIALQEYMAEAQAKGFALGEARGIALGEARGEANLLLRILQRRFGALDDALVARVRAADTAQLDVWSERMLDAGSLDAVFAGPQLH